VLFLLLAACTVAVNNFQHCIFSGSLIPTQVSLFLSLFCVPFYAVDFHGVAHGIVFLLHIKMHDLYVQRDFNYNFLSGDI